MRLLVVRLTSLGDVVHAIPAVAALRRTYPAARIDWLVGERCRELVELVPVIDRCLVAPRPRAAAAFPRLVAALRAARYDAAIDLQGLLKSAVLARWSGARRVIGFGRGQVRERAARLLYTETPPTGVPGHIIDKNLALVAALDVDRRPAEFPIAAAASDVVERVREGLGGPDVRGFALLNPGAAWTSKCWPPERFGELARRLRRERGLRSIVAWGTGERERAGRVVAASDAAAALAPPTRLADLVAMARAATVMVAGDTGPLHIAAALGTPVVGLYGPTDPRRNGPWSAADLVVSHYGACGCRRDPSEFSGVVVRRCAQARPCMSDIPVDEVAEAVFRRIGAASDA